MLFNLWIRKRTVLVNQGPGISMSAAIYVPAEKMARICLIHSLNDLYRNLFAYFSEKLELPCSAL